MHTQDDEAVPVPIEIMELEKVRKIRAQRGRKKYTRSPIEPFRSNIKTLLAAGASAVEIHCWLDRERGVKVHLETMRRFLRRLKETAK